MTKQTESRAHVSERIIIDGLLRRKPHHKALVDQRPAYRQTPRKDKKVAELAR